MSTQARRARVARLGELAAEQEEQARAEMLRADHRVAEVDRRRADALQGAADLADHHVSLALRGHLAGAGARHLVQLAGERADRSVDADRARGELAEAVTRVRSLERLVDRIDRAESARLRQRELADLQDLVAIRAAHEGTGNRSGRNEDDERGDLDESDEDGDASQTNGAHQTNDSAGDAGDQIDDHQAAPTGGDER